MDYYDATSLARKKMNEHGLGGWILQIDRSKRRAGCCFLSRKTISLSKFYIELNKQEDVLDTILHEIAHALAGPGHNHNAYWRSICIKIGAKPIRCCGASVTMPMGKWQAQCKKCNKVFHRHRKPKYLNLRYCMKCGPNDGTLEYKKTNGGDNDLGGSN